MVAGVSIGPDRDGGRSDFSLRATKCQTNTQLVHLHPQQEKALAMIDPPSQQPGDPERAIELDQTVDYAVQLLVEEAHLVGWQRAEFLQAISDTANARLAAFIEGAETQPLA